ncbi:MAG: HAMP domain-containing protein, partial [Pseudomonadota bacterium]|nr:HAMP domain-containing protein [Pseudomonadota bacterium]
MQLSLKNKFITLGVAAVAASAISAIMTLKDISVIDQQADQVSGVDNLRIAQMQADMMHDAIRGDMAQLLAAMQKEDHQGRQVAAASYAEHKKSLEEAMGEIKKLDISDELKQMVAKVSGQFADYEKGADAIIAADMDAARANAAYNAFNEQFHALEKSQDDYEKAATKAKDAIDQEQNETVASAKRNLSIIALISAALALAVPVFAIMGVFRPLSRMIRSMHTLADGNTDSDIPYLKRNDEMGSMAKTVQVFKDNALAKARMEREQKQMEMAAELEKKAMMKKLADDFQASVQGIITTVAAAATELYQTAEGMQKTISDVSVQSSTAAASSAQTSSNVQSVSAAVEEMAASVKEIASQVTKSSVLVTETVGKAQQADQTALTLSSAVTQISSILELIQSIASQINLLALNATIESARAGDAGKGFAVVASEVKNLAGQTTKATEEIAKQIANVQRASSEVVEVLKIIQAAIGNVNQYSSGIASAVEEQSAATNEISSNMHHAAQGVQTITANITQITSGASNADHSS